MIVKKTKQLGNFKRGINLYVPRRSSSAPAGIPTATTTIINISVPSYEGFYSNFQKSLAGNWEGPSLQSALIFTGTRWEINYLGDVFSLNTLASQTVNFIPQTNWSVPTTITVVA